ncbi:MAG: hypothetical protein CVU61_02010 [Deltaproteobacteria bacterium HGW-Deltaproteobacteria-19]|jgi:hypothetical protein|nr:MAG: hypothetical protein CVU61_02010 [Deltaproteobacteria bacterium HGW-Deltaproteobacteria-19]
MSKSKKRIDIHQLSIFEILESAQSSAPVHNNPPGSLDVDRQFREVVSEALRKCPLSRYQVVARMSELVGQDITKTMLDSWTAESKEGHRFPAVFLPAFCEATGSQEPLRLLGQLVGVFVLPGPEALRAEIRKIEEEIEKKQAEKRKRMTFLKEMEAER